jgi:hypothetical protein
MYAMQPITYTTGAEIQAPYRTILQPGNVQSGVALGPVSRMEGECFARHGSIPGMGWGKFSSQNTRAVDQYDPTVSGALTTQWALASQPFNTLNPTGNVSNVLSYAQSSQPQQTMSEAKSSLKATQATQDKAAQKEAAKQKREAAKAMKAAEREAQKAERQAKKGAAKSSGATCNKNGSCSSCE